MRANPLLRTYVVPAAKRAFADLYGIAAPIIGNVLTGKKNLKSMASDVGEKTLRKQLGGGKNRKCGIIQKIPKNQSTSSN